ncbi:hypothetical protein VTL71DRAFT_9799 [Oculimacula yallundae]|uniref:chitinase n=1 Tax=Oculimacula yallundae TaxID=86028 RepID=A0ABR4BQH9_9HELO
MIFLREPVVFFSVYLLTTLCVRDVEATTLPRFATSDEIEFEHESDFNFYPRSQGFSSHAVTHQQPEHLPPHTTHNVDEDYTLPLPYSLARRDATKCLSDGTCADKSCCSNKGICGYGPSFCGKGNCTGGCEATAMCGIYSKDSKVKCGMNLCCSATGWCGTTDTYCTNADPINHSLPCQKNFGSCEVKKGRTCGTGSGTTNGRTIGYYQGSNGRDRLCNKIVPSDIATGPSTMFPKGYTHLYYSFASINPSTFVVVPADQGDVALYTQFTALRRRGIQTWIAVGGFDFSDPGKPTYGTWSKLASSAANRKAFIDSLEVFMTKYGFQGADIDWEYPVEPNRGGNPLDTQNLVLLMAEMRAKFGSRFGISMTLAPDYWYLRYFDAKAMESSVDFFGFMTYDLHGYWDTDVKTLGSIVRGQADIRDIANNTIPLWFAELDLSKINFGLALYGRGYTLTSSSCNDILCPFSGPSKRGICTNSLGVMSLIEIEQLIKKKKLTPKNLPNSMMKQITWDDQWIGYDDADTIKQKKAWADNYCFGGTMTWSIDFYSGAGSGLEPTNTTDGTCGSANGNTVCGDFPNGSCCSASGYCRRGSAYCGGGCQSGDCDFGGETTDGTCGIAKAGTYCGLWPQGSCCSPSGYCGRTKAHCGTGCQSGPCGWGVEGTEERITIQGQNTS